MADIAHITRLQVRDKAGLERLIALDYTDDLVIPFGCLSEVSQQRVVSWRVGYAGNACCARGAVQILNAVYRMLGTHRPSIINPVDDSLRDNIRRCLQR